MDDTPLECMLVILECPFMHVVCHKSVSLVYQSHSINFLQEFSRFFGTEYIPRRSSNTPYFVIVQRGFNDEVYEAKVCHFVFLKLAQYLIQHNPMYQGRFLDMDAVSSFP